MAACRSKKISLPFCCGILFALVMSLNCSHSDSSLSGFDRLYSAVKERDKSKIISLLDDEGISVDVRGPYRRTVLMGLAQDKKRNQTRKKKNSTKAIAKMLLKRTRDVDLRDRNGVTALMFAASSGNCLMFDVLLEKGASMYKKDHSDITVLMRAAEGGSVAIVRQALAGGSDLSNVDIFGMTPLMYGSENGKIDSVRELLDHAPAMLNHRARRGETGLMLALASGHIGMAKVLLSYEGIDLRGALSSVKPDSRGYKLLSKHLSFR